MIYIHTKFCMYSSSGLVDTGIKCKVFYKFRSPGAFFYIVQKKYNLTKLHISLKPVTIKYFKVRHYIGTGSLPII
jgi:hypothetical protein